MLSKAMWTQVMLTRANVLLVIAVGLLISGCGRTPARPTPELHFAALQGDTEKAQLLIANGENINKKGNRGTTALHLAAFKGHTDTAKVLIGMSLGTQFARI